MPIEYRRVGPDDAALFANVDGDIFDGPIVPARLAAYLADPQNLMLLALDGDLAVGQIACVVHRHPDLPTELYIDNLGVAPSHQRRGVARALVSAAFAWGRELGCEEAWVGTELDNDPARRLYEAFDGEPAETFVLYAYDLEER